MAGSIFVLVEAIRIFRMGINDAKARWRQEVGVGVAVVAACWLVLFAISIVQGVYQDHVGFVAQVQAARNEKKACQTKCDELQSTVQQLSDANQRMKIEMSAKQAPASRPALQPATPKLRVDLTPFPSAADGLPRIIMHLWTNIPLRHPTYLVVCDRPPAELQVGGCGCGRMYSSTPDVIGNVTWNGEIIPRNRYLLFTVSDPDPVDPDYFIEVEAKSKDKEYPRCQARLQPVTP